MKPLPLILIAFAISATVSAVTVALLAPSAVEGGSSAGRGAGSEVTQLRNELEAQSDRLRKLENELAMQTPTSSTRTPVNDLEAMVRKAVAAQLGNADQGAQGSAEEEDDFDGQSALSDILAMRAAGASYEDIEAYWRKMREEGRTDEMVGIFEEYAELNPGDPEAQLLLGNAYLQRLQESPTGPEMGEWAGKADTAFDTALGLDENNWDARLSKAVSLSFWPPIFGKQGEAIDQFEILLEKQKSAAPNSNHAQTYKYLGNLYQQQGDSEKAKAIWQEGYAAFPDDEALAEKFKPDSSN